MNARLKSDYRYSQAIVGGMVFTKDEYKRVPKNLETQVRANPILELEEGSFDAETEGSMDQPVAVESGVVRQIIQSDVGQHPIGDLIEAGNQIEAEKREALAEANAARREHLGLAPDVLPDEDEEEVPGEEGAEGTPRKRSKRKK